MEYRERGIDRNAKCDVGSAIELQWLSTKEAATYCGVGQRTLERYREQQTGPKPYRFGKRFIRYKKSDLDAFFAPEVQH